MNALTRSAVSSLPRATSQIGARRFASSQSFVKNWLSDPGAYPIIGILAAAVIGCSGFIGYKFTQCPDVRITGKHKGQVIRSS